MRFKLTPVPRLALILALILGAMPLSGCKSEPPVPITVAWSPFESLGLFFVAYARHFFTDNGLDVTQQKYDSGANALKGMLAGEADIVVGTTEFPLVNQSLQKVDIKTFGTIAKSQFIYIIARKDRGIAKPSDLKGKRVGTTIGSISEFHLGRYLELNGLSFKDLTVVDLKTPEEWTNAVVRGDVDAVCTAQPYAEAAKKGLGDNAVFWPAQSSQALFAQVIAAGTWLAAHPDLAERFLKALAQAEEYIASHRTESLNIVRERLNLDPGYMDTVWSQNQYALTLDQSLITAMEDETRWLIANNLTTERSVPDFLHNIYEDALKKVTPDAVRIIR
jgi:ABC-type nitrate/sulfonate/bicarbonate transport system substrate-binding protein